MTLNSQLLFKNIFTETNSNNHTRTIKHTQAHTHSHTQIHIHKQKQTNTDTYRYIQKHTPTNTHKSYKNTFTNIQKQTVTITNTQSVPSHFSLSYLFVFLYCRTSSTVLQQGCLQVASFETSKTTKNNSVRFQVLDFFLLYYNL